MNDARSPAWDPSSSAEVSREIRQISTAVVLCFLVSGAVGLIYEVLWIRLLGLLFGHTVFSVTTVLASFMAGLGVGSYLFGRIADRSTRLLTLYGLLEIGIGVYCLLLPNFLGWVEEVYRWISRALTFSYITFSAVQFLLVALLLMIPTCLMGATLPVLARFFVREEATLGRQVGMLYSVNTLGAVCGALLAGYWLVPALGIHTTIRLAVVMNVGIGSLVLVFERHLHRLAAAQRRSAAAAYSPAGPGAAGVTAAGGALLPPWDPVLMSSGVAIYGQQYLPLVRAGEFGQPDWQPEVPFYRDGISATVSVHRDGPATTLRVNGKADAGNTLDMHTQLFSAHIPMLLHPRPKRVLVIGLGSGVTAGAVAQYPVEQIDIIEIEPAVVEAARFFTAENRAVLRDPRVRLIIADGRNFLLNAREPYDVIISEPSNPWIRGLATLFTREFYALAKSRLAPDGLMLQWIQGYGIAPDDLRMVVRSFRTAFPDSTLWYSATGDNFLVGASRPVEIPLTRIQAQYETSPALREDFARVGMLAPAGLLADFLLGSEDLRRYAGDGPLNTDDTLWLEFSTPQSLYETGNDQLNYRILSSYRSTDLPPLSPSDRACVETAEGRYSLGRALMAKRFLHEAEFSRAGRLDPLHVGSRMAEARLLIQRGMVLKAVRILEEILARGHLPEALALLQPLLADAGRQPVVIRARARYLVGLIHLRAKRIDEAVAALDAAARLAPLNAGIRLDLSQAYEAKGDLERAAETLERLLAFYPNHLVAMRRLAALLGRLEASSF